MDAMKRCRVAHFLLHTQPNHLPNHIAKPMYQSIKPSVHILLSTASAQPSKWWVRLLSAGFLCLLTTNLLAAEKQFVEGNHYELLRETQPTQSGNKIEVVELFWYGCPHCYRLEPFITEWLQNKPQNAEFFPIPAILNKSWEFDARIYYTLQSLGLDETLHPKVFDALHKDNRPLQTIQQFADWAVEHGAERQPLISAANSFTVQNKINFSRVMSRKYSIHGVPAFIVDGKYRTSVSLAGSQAALMEVVNYLIGLAAAQRAG